MTNNDRCCDYLTDNQLRRKVRDLERTIESLQERIEELESDVQVMMSRWENSK